ncbi:MAG: DUF6436 domain-containing protein [Mucilaginibacter sp.]
MRKLIVGVWLIFLLIVVGALFWYNELVYQLPTPIPKDYKPVYRGQLIKLTGKPTYGKNQPVFLHFFNPDCPCSRFNIASFKSLVDQYGSQVHFVVVVLNNSKYTAKQVQDKFNLNIPVVFDASLASSCGVYSTPQAVLLDAQHQLYYRGNYNRSRYCTDERTNYAKAAIQGLLNQQTNLVFSQLALRAYGCRLPNCKQ